MKKNIIVIMAVGIILVSFASAGLVDFLSNTVSGSVEVKGPVWYFDSVDIMGDGSYSLKLNDDDISGSWFQLKSDSTSTKELFSESLSVDGFYPLKFDVSIDADIEYLNQSANEYGSIEAIIYLVRESGSYVDLISLCDVVYLWENDDRSIHTFECDAGDSLVDIDEEDRIKLVLNDGSPTDSRIKVYLGESKLQMVPKNE